MWADGLGELWPLLNKHTVKNGYQRRPSPLSRCFGDLTPGSFARYGMKDLVSYRDELFPQLTKMMQTTAWVLRKYQPVESHLSVAQSAANLACKHLAFMFHNAIGDLFLRSYLSVLSRASLLRSLFLGSVPKEHLP